MEEVTTAFTTAVATIKTDTMSMLVVALPAALTLIGVFFAIKKGISFFRNVSNKA